MKRLRLLKGLAVAGLVLAAACGDDSGGGGVASLDGTEAGDDSPTAAEDASDASQEELQDAFVEYAECMRAEGIDMPDPEVSDGGVRIGSERSPALDDSDFEEADEQCRPLVDDVAGRQELDPEAEAERQDQFTAMAQCMRDRGHDMPDPQVDGGRVMVEREGEPGDEDDDFEADMEACSDEAGLDGPGTRLGGED